MFAPATAEDVRVFYGSVNQSMRAICVKRDGLPVGFVGLAIEQGYARFFSEYRDLSTAELCCGWRAVKAAMRYVRESKRPVVAVAMNDHGHKNLTRLGFVRLKDDLYGWMRDGGSG